MNHSNKLKVLAWSLLLATWLQATPPETKVISAEKHIQQEALEVLSGPERAQRRFAELTQQAVYDGKTKASYVFSTPIQDEYLDAIMQKENLYYADPHSLIVQIQDETVLSSFQKAWYNYKKIADSIYSLSVDTDIQGAKTSLENLPGVAHVNYNCFLSPLVGWATYWNDPWIWHNASSIRTQTRLHDDWRVNNWYKNVITQSVDSIEAVKVFHNATTVNMHVIDMGLNTASPEYNLKGSYNIETWSTGNIESAHGNAVSADAVGRLNNNYGWWWVAPWFPLFSYDAERSGMPWYLTSNFIITALQKIYDYALAHPDEINIINMSFGTTNDPVILSLIQQIQWLKDEKQNFLVSASGNSGNAQPVSYPARYDQVFAIWSSKANTATRALWDGTQLDNTLDFVIDGAGGFELHSTDGSLVQSNGTSFASPKFAWLLAQLQAQREGASSSNAVSWAGDLLDMDQVRAKVKKWAVKTGEMNSVELWYPSAWRALRERVVEDLPENVDAQNDPNFKINFTPKFYNTSDVTMQKNRKMLYPNGKVVPSSIDPTTGLITFHLSFSTANGFAKDKPVRLAYQFTGFAGDQKKAVLVDIPKILTVNNVTAWINDLASPIVNVRPNPVARELHIPLSPDIASVGVQVSSITGQQLKATILENTGNQCSLDVSDLPEGIYVLTLTSNRWEKIWVAKFTKGK